MSPFQFIGNARDALLQRPKDPTKRPLYQAQALDFLAHSFEIAIPTTNTTDFRNRMTPDDFSVRHDCLHPLRGAIPQIRAAFDSLMAARSFRQGAGVDRLLVVAEPGDHQAWCRCELSSSPSTRADQPGAARCRFACYNYPRYSHRVLLVLRPAPVAWRWAFFFDARSPAHLRFFFNALDIPKSIPCIPADMKHRQNTGLFPALD